MRPGRMSIPSNPTATAGSSLLVHESVKKLYHSKAALYRSRARTVDRTNVFFDFDVMQFLGCGNANHKIVEEMISNCDFVNAVQKAAAQASQISSHHSCGIVLPRVRRGRVTESRRQCATTSKMALAFVSTTLQTTTHQKGNIQANFESKTF